MLPLLDPKVVSMHGTTRNELFEKEFRGCESDTQRRQVRHHGPSLLKLGVSFVFDWVMPPALCTMSTVQSPTNSIEKLKSQPHW